MELKCRTCSLKVEPDEATTNVFTQNSENQLLSEVLMQLAPITIIEEDSLPKTICSSCSEKLSNFCEFRKTVIESDFNLRRAQELLEQECIDLIEDSDGNLSTLTDSSYAPKEEILLDAVKEEFSFVPELSVEDKRRIAQEQLQSLCSKKPKIRKPTPELLEHKCINLIEDSDGNLSNLIDSNSAPKEEILLVAVKEEFLFVPELSVEDKRRIAQEQLESLYSKNPTASRKAKESLTCEFCNKIFKIRSRLMMHQAVHTGIKPFCCEICNKGFAVKQSLQIHGRTHSDKRPYKCTRCEKFFRTQGNLDVHSKIHVGSKPYTCLTCGKNFIHSGALKLHERTHTGEKPFVCEFCSAMFAQKPALMSHIKCKHTENPELFSCNLCGKGFKLKVHLNRHRRTHTGEKIWQCQTCDKKFGDRGTLKIHTRIHTGERPYSCKVCKKNFYQHSILMRHMRTHTGEKPYPCTICEKRFPYSHHLLKHVERYHPDAAAEK